MTLKGWYGESDKTSSSASTDLSASSLREPTTRMVKKTEKSAKTHVITNPKYFRTSNHNSRDVQNNSNTRKLYKELKWFKKEKAIKVTTY